MTPKPPPSPALAAMWEEDLARGVDPTGDMLRPTAPRPVEVVEPIIRPIPPPADWRREQMEAERPTPTEPAPRPGRGSGDTSTGIGRRRRVKWKGPR